MDDILQPLERRPPAFAGERIVLIIEKVGERAFKAGDVDLDLLLQPVSRVDDISFDGTECQLAQACERAVGWVN